MSVSTYEYIYNEIQKDINFYVSASIQNASEKLHVSIATMHRAVRHFGFETYSEFRIHLYNEEIKKTNHDKAQQSDDQIGRVFASYSESVNDTYKWINQNRQLLGKFTADIKNAKNVYTFGIGASSFAAENLSKKATLVKCPFSHIDDFYSMLKILTNAKGAFVVLFSRSGISSEIFFLVRKMISLKLKFALVTDNDSHPLKDEIPHMLVTSSVKRKSRATEVSSKISQLMISDLIAGIVLPEFDLPQVKKFDEIMEEWWNFRNENNFLIEDDN